MSIVLVTGPANSGKAQVVMAAVRRHISRRAEPLLVVPTRADVEYYLRELAGGEAAMGVRVLVFDDLVEELVRRAGVTGRPLGRLARERLIGALPAAAQAADRPGVAPALGELFAELQTARVTPGRLGAGLDAGLGDGAAALGLDLAGAYGEYLRRLERIGRMDEQQRLLRALDRLRERPFLWGRPPTPVLFYGFDDLTPLQLDAIETLGRVLDAEVTVSLAYEAGRAAFAGRAGTFQTLAPLASDHVVLEPQAEHYAEPSRAPLSHIERNLFQPGAPRADPGRAVELMQGGGERAELELIATGVAALLRDGVPAEEIAVVMRRPGASAPLVAELFRDAGVPLAMPVKRPFGDTAVGRALIGLLRCVPAPGGGAAPGTPEDLLVWLRAPGVLRVPELADSLELELRRRGVGSVEQARLRWEENRFALDAIDRLAEAQRRGPGALAERAGRELLRLFTLPRRGAASVLDAEEMDEARALAGGRAALAELRELAALARDAAPGSAFELASVLAGVEVNSGELPGPGLVAVLEPLQLRARRVRALFLAGLQEGEFPLRARSQPLLGERERAAVARASGLLLGEPEDVLAAERYLLYAILSRPEERLALSWHETDDDAAPLSRSLFVDDVCDLFDERLHDRRTRRALGALDPRDGAEAGPAALPAAGRLVDERVLERMRARPWSGTSIERWVSCPVAWFVERLLAPERFEPEPEPLVRGTLAHLALRETLEGLRRETGSARLTHGNLGRARELMRSALARGGAEQRLSVSAEREAVIERGLRADLERYLEHAAGLEGSLVPAELELGFGFDTGEDDHGEPSELPAFDLGGGARMRGRIDRVDIGANGEAVVVDYKAKTAPAGEKWISERNLQVALYMQVAERLLGVRVVGGLYQPLSGKDLRARGVLLEDHDWADNCVRTDRLDEDALAALLSEALEIARGAAREAGEGALEPRPESCGYRGRGCMFPTICRCER